MDYLFNDEHLDLVKEQVWECKDDISVYGKLAEYELECFKEHLPETVHMSLEMGAGMGRGSIQLSKLYPDAWFVLADRQGRTKNDGIFFPETDEYYNDFKMTESFCLLNKLRNFETFDTEEGDWNSLPLVDLITSRCAMGFHFPIDRYIDRLIEVSSPDVTMIFGVNCLFKDHERYEDRFKEVHFIGISPKEPFPHQSWLVLKGLKDA